MRVVELIDFPEGTLTENGPARRYQRFAVGAFVASPTGTLRIPAQAPNSGWQLVLENDTPRFIGEMNARLRSLDEAGDSTIFRVEMGEAVVLFRVVPDELPALAWPAELDDVITAVAPGVAGLDVLHDSRLHPRRADERDAEPRLAHREVELEPFGERHHGELRDVVGRHRKIPRT